MFADMLSKKKSPREQIFQLKMEMKKPQRRLNAEVVKINRQIEVLTMEIKKAQDDTTRKTLAKALIKAKKAKERCQLASVEIDSITYSLTDQMNTQIALSGIAKINGLTEKMQKLYRTPEIQSEMMNLSKQMTKMKIMDEMISDTMDSTFDVDEEVVDQEVESVILELTKDTMKNAPSAVKDKLPNKVSEPTSQKDEDLLTSRLENLLN